MTTEAVNDVTDLSNDPPMKRSDLRDSELAGNPTRRCKAHRKNGDQCRRWAIHGGNVCATHGGRARQVVAKARLRLMENADPAVKQLLKIAFDDNSPIETRLKATLAAIDRAGLSPKTEVELEITAKPFEAILDQMDSGSRADYRRSQGIEDDTSVPQGQEYPAVDYLRVDADDDLIVEGIVLDDVDDDGELILNDDDGFDVFDGDGQPITPGEYGRGPDGQPWADAPGPFGPTGPPPNQGMMPLNDAVQVQAEMRKHAVLRPVQRALPRGRS